MLRIAQLALPKVKTARIVRLARRQSKGLAEWGAAVRIPGGSHIPENISPLALDF